MNLANVMLRNVRPSAGLLMEELCHEGAVTSSGKLLSPGVPVDLGKPGVNSRRELKATGSYLLF